MFALRKDFIKRETSQGSYKKQNSSFREKVPVPFPIPFEIKTLKFAIFHFSAANFLTIQLFDCVKSILSLFVCTNTENILQAFPL